MTGPQGNWKFSWQAGTPSTLLRAKQGVSVTSVCMMVWPWTAEPKKLAESCLESGVPDIKSGATRNLRGKHDRCGTAGVDIHR
jgi:hypothetical protein